jgi:hypothetical protein
VINPRKMSRRRAQPITFVRNDRFTSLEREPREQRASAVGSREHFFHFLLGYLLPVVHEQELNRFNRIRVLDCGPLMTPILSRTLTKLGYDFEVVPNKRLKNPVVVAEWDHHWEDNREVRQTVEKVADVWLKNIECQELDCPTSKRILLQRSNEHPYYKSGGKAESYHYGYGRRGIKNVTEISHALSDSGIDHDLYEPGRHSLGCQILIFRRATHISGIRGAEWANLVWAKPNLKALIFDPLQPATMRLNLMQRLGIQGTCITVQENHIELEVELFLKFYI